MEIAILMSTYNGEKYLSEQLESISKQSLINDIKLYVRDDGSKDKSFEILEQWKNKIDITIMKEKNVGPGKSFWELMINSQIQADYYAFCDQDDVWDSDKIEKGVTKLQSGYDLYISNCRLISKEGKLIKSFLREEPPIISIQRQFASGIAQGCSMIFTKGLRDWIINLNLECIPMHDTIVILYALAYGNVYWDQNPTFGYRMHENNVIAKNNKTIVQKIKTTYRTWKNGSKSSYADIAKELLRNCHNLSESDVKYLNLVKDYKRNIFIRLKLLKTTQYSSFPKEHAKSYIARIILKLY